MNDTGWAARPRIGDEVVFEVKGGVRRLLVTEVKDAKRVVKGAKNPDEKVANLRASMGDEWAARYWMALLKAESGTLLWMDVLEVAKYGGKVESKHLLQEL